jgi:hypothetical protein
MLVAGGEVGWEGEVENESWTVATNTCDVIG